MLLPAKDAEGTIDRAVASVLSEHNVTLELIAVDDHSADGTWARLQAHAARDPRVRPIRASGRGLVAALNQALAEARGELIARMDADDESLPGRLVACVAALDADASLCGVGTQVEVVRDDRPVAPNLKLYEAWLNSLTTPERLFQERFIESPLCHPSVMVRKRSLEAAGGYRDGPFAEDYELWLRLLERGERLSCVPQVLYRWADHDRRLTRADPRYTLERHLELKADYLSRVHVRQPSLWVWGAGPTGLKLTRLLAARGVEVSRFVDVHPRKVGQRIHGIPVDGQAALGGYDGHHLLAAVGSKGAREEIRQALHERGWREGEHFTCVA